MKLFAGLILALFSFSAFAQDRGLCYSSLQNETFQEPIGYSATPLESQDRNIRHWYALRASMDIYNLPDLENTRQGGDFAQKFESFLNNPVPGYSYWEFKADRESGLKYAILAPQNPIDPWIFAFAGTENSIDWVADLDLARGQVRKIEDMVLRFADCLNFDSEGTPLAAKNWLIAGHSLGGGLAQIFAYKVASLRILKRLAPGKLELVTFNGFGSMDLVLPDPASADIVVPTILTANYFVRGDVVSRIGLHLGNTYELIPSSNLNPISAHALSTIESLVVTGDYVDFSGALAVAPPYSGTLNALKKTGSVVSQLLGNSSTKLITRLEQLTMLEQAANFLIKRGLSTSTDYLALEYIKNIAADFKTQLEAEPSSNLKQDMIDDLTQLIYALDTY